MGYYDFPHTRNYDTDLGYLIDWFKRNRNKIELNTATTIEKALTATEEAVKAYNSATNAANSATNASNSAKLALELKNQTEALKNLMQDKIDQIDTNTNRIDNLATIDQGSITTTGDAELVDIRVGANGITYPNAGDSVRGQVSELKGDLGEITEVINLVIDKLVGYTIETNGALNHDSQFDIQIAKVEQGKTYTISTDSQKLICAFYDSYPEYLHYSYNRSRIEQDSMTITAPIDGYICFRTTSGYKYAQIELGTKKSPYIKSGLIAKDNIARRDIVNLKNDIFGYAINDIEFQKGYRHGVDYLVTNSSEYAISKFYFVLKPGFKIQINNNAYKGLLTFESNHTYYAWITDEYIVDREDRCYIELKRVDGADITEYDSLSSVVSIILDGIIDNTNDVVYVSSSANNSGYGSKDNPFNSIQKAINIGAKIIFVASGIYTESLEILDKNNISILLWNFPTWSTSATDKPKIHISGGSDNSLSSALFIENSSNITIENLWCSNVNGGTIVFARNCKNITFNDCIASDGMSSGCDGFAFSNTNVIMNNCEAYNVKNDGFNFHQFGHSVITNCYAHNCGDDGISHHDGCTGIIIGGEYSYCSKGGISTPTYGANVNIDGAYVHNNTNYGLLVASQDGYPKCKAIVKNCAIKNNNVKDIKITYSDVIGFNNIYSSKDVDSNSTFTEIN